MYRFFIVEILITNLIDYMDGLNFLSVAWERQISDNSY